MAFQTEVVRINKSTSLTYCKDEATGFYAVTYNNERTNLHRGKTGRSFVEALHGLYFGYYDYPKTHAAFIEKEMKRLAYA